MLVLIAIAVFTVIVGAVFCPIAWIVFEVKGKQRGRLALGLISIVLCSVLAWNMGSGLSSLSSTFTLNANYGSTIELLIDRVIIQLESDNAKTVLEEFKRLRDGFPSYIEAVGTEKALSDMVRESVNRMDRNLDEETIATREPSQQIENGTPERPARN